MRSVQPGRSMRIRIPQPEDRPLQLRKRNLVIQDFLREDPWWWTLHRRGPKRERVGLDPLEERAVPKEQVRGTLPERIIYLALIKVLHMVPDADFDFQSSMQGGRLEFGGIVADFVIFAHKTIINPLGPTHEQFIRKRKDEEQRGILESLGYRVLTITENEVYNEFYLDSWLRRNFGLSGSRGGAGGALGPHDKEEYEHEDQGMLNLIWDEVLAAENKLDNLFWEYQLLL